MTAEKLVAPWTRADAATLNYAQWNPVLHPFTCPNRSDGNHNDWGPDLGALVATTDGWVCMYCDYTQDWAHKWWLDTVLVTWEAPF